MEPTMCVQIYQEIVPSTLGKSFSTYPCVACSKQ